MRLWVLLDEIIDRVKIKEEDIVFTNDLFIANKYLNSKIYIYDPEKCSINDKVVNEVNIFFKLIDNKKIEILKNDFFMKIFRPAASIISQVKSILEENVVEEVHLIGGSKIPFLTLCRGEGEGVKYKYKSSWLVNGILFKVLSQDMDRTVIWEMKESNLKTIYRHFFRENFFLARRFISSLLTSISMNFKENEINLDLGKKTLVFVTLKELQYRHLSSAFSSDSKFNKVYISEKLYSDCDILHIFPKGLFTTFICFINLFRKLVIPSKLIFQNQFGEFQFSRRYLQRTLRPAIYSIKMETSSIFNTIEKNKIPIDYLITDYSFGADLCDIHETCVSNGIRHINYQYVSMWNMLFPKLDLADEYYLFSQKVFNTLSQYSDIYKLYLPISNLERQNNENILILTIFLQPDGYAARYISFIDEFCGRLSNFSDSIKVLVKPHYRQNLINEIKEIVKKYSFITYVNKNDSVRDLLAKSDFILSITSSVLFEAFTVNVPAIIIDNDGISTCAISNNDYCMQDVNFRVNSIDELYHIIKNHQEFKAKYEERRKNYLEQKEVVTEILNTL